MLVVHLITGGHFGMLVGVVKGCIFVFFFFFQAEDGIRDYKVTGVQTCALPISTPAVTPTFILAKFCHSDGIVT